MSSSVEQIKEKLTIVDVISSYLKLERAGGNYKAVCPFHNEKSPSFFVSPSRGSYYCFGCGAKGDIFSFVEQFEGLDFKGALQALALRAGVTLEQYRGADPKEKNLKDRLYTLLEKAAAFYERELAGNAEAKTYVESRGITNETKDQFRIGYAPAEWRALTEALRSSGFTDEEIVASGLSKHPDAPSSNGGGIYDRFRDRIMFPISDSSGRVIAFSGRLLHDAGDASVQQGKYINSPETPIFKKGSVLYGLDKAKFEIRKRDMAILVEGQMDLVLSHQAGFANTVASSGTALGDSLVSDNDSGALSGLGQVRALSNNLTIAFDADKAGMKAAGRAERIGLAIGMNVKVAHLPKEMDPADVIRKLGKEEWKKIIEGAEHIVLFYLSVLNEHSLSPHTRMRAIRDRILPYIAVMPSAIERDHFIRVIREKTGISEEALAEDVLRLIKAEDDKRKPEIKNSESKLPTASRTAQIENRLLGILLWQEESSPPYIDPKPLRERLEAVLGKERFAVLVAVDPEKKQERIFEVEILYNDSKRLADDVKELLDNLEEELLGRALQDLMMRMSEAEQKGEQASIQDILEESQKITNRLNTIKSARFK